MKGYKVDTDTYLEVTKEELANIALECPLEPSTLINSSPEGRSCIYVPITQNGRVVDSQGFMLDPEDE